MGKTNRKSSRKQKVYKMVGCSKTRKNYLGGSSDLPLAYTGKPVFSIPNPHLAYTGKGGAGCGLTANTSIPLNTNAANRTVPNTGPVAKGGETIFNNASTQKGGCGCGLPYMGGGKNGKIGGSSSLAGFMIGGTRHRSGCKCSSCKKRVMKGGNAGIPYPDGLVGSPWTPSVGGWPGVNGVPGDSNHYSVNNYKNDISRQMSALGGNPPFSNVKGGANLKGRTNVKSRKQRGGSMSNFIGDDLINLGRQFQFGIGSAYNALAGYSGPVNPLPWKDQFHSKAPFNPARI
jgi:hypothetical protein